MRVCILSAFEDTTQKNDGPSVRVCNLAEGLSRAGDSVSLVMPSVANRLGRIDHFSVCWIRGFVPSRLLRALRGVFGVKRYTALYFYDFLFITRVAPIIRKCDVLQIEQQTAGGLLLPFAKYFLKKPIIVDCHDVFQALRLRHTNLIRRFIETWLEKLSYKFASMILVVSEREKTMLGNAALKAKVTVVPNGVDTAKFKSANKNDEILERYGLRSRPIVVFVGNLDYEPNREALNLISSVIAPKVISALPKAKFLAVGKCTEILDLPNVVFTGKVNDVADFLAVSDVAIAPLLHGSGTRLKILEYLAFGLPVVSTSIGADGLDVEDGVNILIADDWGFFSAKVTQLLQDKAMAVKIGRAGSGFAQKYDWRDISRRLQSAYSIVAGTNN